MGNGFGGKAALPARLERARGEYGGWLARQPLSANTRRAYATRVSLFLGYLASAPSEGYGDPLEDAHARDYAARDFKAHLKTVGKAKPSSVNLTLAAVDNFYRFLGLGKPEVRREEPTKAAPRALSPVDQRRFLRAVERCASARDRAIATLFFYSALRLQELAWLDVGDVAISARRGRVLVRSGKGDAYREVALNADAREALDGWLAERRGLKGVVDGEALFLGRRGRRLTARAVDLIVRRLGEEANLGVPLSAHVLRHTCLTNLVRNGNDLVMVAEIAGHKRLETTRRYSLPSEADREAAMEGIRVEH
jgi:site-specific recombinase XerD